MRKYSFVFLLLLSCRSNEGNVVAIRDFKPSLRPWLVQAAGIGIVGYDTATRYIRAHARDKELVLLSHSDQPILRAIALEEMMDRTTFDHFNVIMDHLDDTAMIAMDAGEWGFRQMTVSDFLVQERGKWKTEALRAITMDSILFHHDYLKAAYTAINRVNLNAALYPHVRRMVQRDRDYRDIEDAWLAHDSSAAILRAIVERKPFMPCRIDTGTPRRTLVQAIWDNPCPAYAELRQETLAWKRYYAYSDSVAGVYPIDVGPNLDTAVRPEPVRWGNRSTPAGGND